MKATRTRTKAIDLEFAVARTSATITQSRKRYKGSRRCGKLYSVKKGRLWVCLGWKSGNWLAG